MNRLKSIVLGAAFVALPAIAQAQTITFDDLDGGCGVDPLVTNGYNGFNWDNVNVFCGANYPGTGFYNGVVSGPNAVFNYKGDWANFSSSNPFTLISVWATDAASNQDVTFVGSLGGNITEVSTFSILENTPTLLTFSDWSNVDYVEFCAGTCSGQNFDDDKVVLDNLTVNATVTPEPATLLLFGTGLLGLGLAAALRRAA